MASEKSKNVKVSTGPNSLIAKRLGTDTLLDEHGRGFEIQPLKLKHRTWIEAHSLGAQNEAVAWAFRLGVVKYIDIEGPDGEPLPARKERVIDSLGREIEYIAEDQFDLFPYAVIVKVAEHVIQLSEINLEDKQKLNFTLASRVTGKA